MRVSAGITPNKVKNMTSLVLMLLKSIARRNDGIGDPESLAAEQLGLSTDG